MHAPAATSAPTQQPPVLIDDSDSDDCVVVSCTDGAGNTSARPQGSPLQPPTNGPGAPELTAGHAAVPNAVPGSAQKQRRTQGGSAADEAAQPSRNAIPRIHADHGACGSRDVLPALHTAAGVGAHGASTLPALASQAGAPCPGKEGGAGPAAAAGTPAAIDKQSDRTTAHHSRTPAPAAVAAAEATTSTQLDHGEGGLRFEGAALPAAAYSASPVLAELAEAGAAASLPLLPMHFRAWLRQTRPAEATAETSGASDGDRALRRLLNAAEVLQDAPLATRTVTALARAFAPPAAASTSAAGRASQPSEHPGTVPTEAQRERTRDIVAKVSTLSLLKILAAVPPVPNDAASSDKSWLRCFQHLLLLLPPRCHPAVLRARCPSIFCSRSLTIPEMALRPGADGLTPSCSTLTVRALAAAICFASGSPACVWKPSQQAAAGPPHLQLSLVPTPLRSLLPGAPSSSPANAHATGSKQAVSRCRTCGAASAPPQGAAKWRVDHNVAPQAADTLTRLQLTLPPSEPLRWCSALVQLRTLRALHLRIRSVDALDTVPRGASSVDGSPQFSLALCALSHLEELHIRAESAIHVYLPYVAGLLVGIEAGVPGLRSLALEKCFKCPAASRPCMMTQKTFGHLMGLTQLSYLSLRDNAINDYAAALLADMLRGTTTLREVCAANACYGAHFVARLCGRKGLTGLRGVDIGCSGATPTELLAPCVLPANGAGLAAVTALDLKRNLIGREQTKDLTALVRGMPGLASLNLAGNLLADKGLRQLAPALSTLSALTHLDVSGNGGSLAALLEAVAEVGRPEGSAGLRRLGIAGSGLTRMRDDDCVDLADTLELLTSLEEVDLRGMPLDVVTLAPVLHALCDLGHVRVVQVDARAASRADLRNAAFEFAAVPGLQRLEVSSAADEDVAAMEEAAVPNEEGDGLAPPLRVVRLPGWEAEDEGGYGLAEVRGAMFGVDMDDLVSVCAQESAMVLHGCPEEEEAEEFARSMGEFASSSDEGW